MRRESLDEIIHSLGETAKTLLARAQTENAGQSTLQKLQAVINFSSSAERLAQNFPKSSNIITFLAWNHKDVGIVKTSLNSLNEAGTWMPTIENKEGKVNEIEYALCKAMTQTCATIKNDIDTLIPKLPNNRKEWMVTTLGTMQGHGEREMYRADPKREEAIDTTVVKAPVKK